MLPHLWNRDDVLGLTLLPRVKAAAVRNAVEQYESLEAMVEAAPREFENVGIIRGSLFPSRICENIRALAAEQCERIEAIGAGFITFWDELYPSLLRHIYYPPVVLYIRGKLQTADAAAIAMVGTRHCTDYGRLVAEQYATAFANNHAVVVSGMAMGIDSYVHRAVLAAEGVTYAVIASGVDKISAAAAEKFARSISERGAVISEYSCGTAAVPAYFPQRNRIISGIAQATLVVESGEKGGSLITARFAIDQDRELFAVPGKISSERSMGTNRLLQRSQAQLTISPDDIFQTLGWKQFEPLSTSAANGTSSNGNAHSQIAFDISAPSKPLPTLPAESVFLTALTDDERRVYDVLGSEPLHIDVVAERAGVGISDLLVVMLELEFKNAVRQMAGKHFVRA